MPPPLFDHDLCLAEAVEDLPVQHFIAEAGVEAVKIAIFLKRSGLDVSRFRFEGADSVPDRQGDELRAIV